MKVLEATDFYFPWVAGPAPFIRDLSLGLEARGHEVMVAAPSPDGRRYEEPGPPAVHRVRTWRVPFGYHLRAGVPMADMTWLVRSWRPDVVHIHHPFPISLAAITAARLHHVPVLATNHTIPEASLHGLRGRRTYGPARAAMSRYIRTVLGAATQVTVPTATAAAYVSSMGYSGNVGVVSNGVDTDRFHPPTQKPSDDPPVVLYTGRLDAEKGVETLIRAVPLVLQSTAARFRIGGEGTDRPRLEALARDLGVSHAVQFTGYVSDGLLADVYRNASIYAISSPVELQSISTLEAMASGLPVAAVDAGALPELVRPGVNGYLARADEPSSLAEAITKLALDPAERRVMGERSRQIAMGHSVDATVSRYEAILQGLAREHSQRAVCGAESG